MTGEETITYRKDCIGIPDIRNKLTLGTFHKTNNRRYN